MHKCAGGMHKSDGAPAAAAGGRISAGVGCISPASASAVRGWDA